VPFSELGVNSYDVNQRAEQLVDTLTMFYSLKEIEAVLFWGFWDQSIWEGDAAFYEGDNVEVRMWNVQFTGYLFPLKKGCLTVHFT